MAYSASYDKEEVFWQLSSLKYGRKRGGTTPPTFNEIRNVPATVAFCPFAIL